MVGSADRAVVALENAVEARPQVADFRVALARAYLARASSGNDPESFLDADDHARRAVELAPKSADASRVRSEALDALRLYDEADLARESARSQGDGASRVTTAGSVPTSRQKRPVERTLGESRRFLLETSRTSDAAKVLRDHPEEIDPAFAVAEEDLPKEWGEAVLAGDGTSSDAILRDAQWLAAGITQVTGDGLLEQGFARARAFGEGEDRRAGETLASALNDLGVGLLARRRFELTEAKARLVAARTALEALGSPFAQLASFHLAICELYLGHSDEARRLVEVGLPQAGANGFRALQGQWHTLAGLLDVFDLRLPTAVHHYESAIEDLVATGRVEAEFNARVNLADALGDLGERREEWRMRFAARSLMGRVRSKTLKAAETSNWARCAFEQEHLGAAIDFADAAIVAADDSGVPGDAVEARVWRAQIRTTRGAYRDALDDIRAADQRLRVIREPALRDWMRGQIALAKARAQAGQDPARAADRWTEALGLFQGMGDDIWRSELYLERGRAHARAGRDDLAERDFEAGARQVESASADYPAGPAISYFDVSRDLFDEMIALQALRRKSPAKALAWAERARARTLREALERHRGAVPRAAGARQERVPQSLPEDIAVVSYVALSEGVITWVARGGHLDQRLTPLPAAAPGAMGASGAEAASVVKPGCLETWYDVLIRPSLGSLAGVRRLVIVPDGALGSIPFAALRDRENGRHLVEDFEITIVPALSIFERRDLDQRDHGAGKVLVVGAPTPDAALYSGLASLPGAALEARAVASLYGNVQELSGADATKSRFLDAIASSRIVHFAGHVVSNAERPELSHLVLARDDASGDAGLLLGREIEALDLSGCELVVLAGCGSGVGRVSRGEGPLSIARSFLVAGSGAVAVTLWDIGDIPSAFLLRAFHESLSEGRTPVQALHRAQLACLSSPDARVRDPKVWAALEIIARSP